MSVRWHLLKDARLLLAAMLAVLPVSRPTAHAQNVSGALAVSATILPPAPSTETRLTAFTVGRDGVARLETTAPVATSASQIVMWSVSSSTNGFVPVAQPPMRIQAARRGEPETPTTARLRFGIDLGDTSSAPTDSSTRDVTVRIQYLIVPGT
jgi:hypothetical protein